MNLRIYTSICCAILVGFATAAQASGPRSSDISFDDADITGSGDRGDLGHDLESSGSGSGPDDDEDTKRPPEHPLPEPGTPDIKVPDNIGGDTRINIKDTISPTEDTGVVMNPKPEDRATSFFAQPGILAAVIGGAVVGLLCAILVVMFIVYRMRKKDEGSYALGEPKQSPTTTSYSRGGGNNKEFYA